MDQTQHLPRPTVEDFHVADRPCSVCTEVALTVTHLDGLPDYVKCGRCQSVYVLDSYSDLVMYGSVSADYPATSKQVLKRWLPAEAVKALAAEERTPTVSGEGEEPTPPFGIGAEASDSDRPAPSTQPFGLGELEQYSQQAGEPSPEPEPSDGQMPARAAAVEPAPPEAAAASDQPATAVSFEPERGQRFRVIVDGEPAFPSDHCAHCDRTPAPRRLPASGELDPPRSFDVPLCATCYRRANAVTEEERNSRLISHLSSVLIGAVSFVLTLALCSAGLDASLVIGIGSATAIGAFGYGVAAYLMLRRPTEFAPPEDANYVATTVLIQSRPNQAGLAFSWRSSRYADRFFAANGPQVQGGITKVFESGRIQRPAVTKR